MIYDDTERFHSDSQWHCPFSQEWVERMKKAAKDCEQLSESYISNFYERKEYSYIVQPGDWLSYDQAANGLPVWMVNQKNHRVSCEIYDYASVPDVVISNGHDDWPLRMWEPVMMA